MTILLPLFGFAAFALVFFGGYTFRKRWQKIQRQHAFNQELMAQQMDLSASPASKLTPKTKQKKSKLSEQERLQKFLERN